MDMANINQKWNKGFPLKMDKALAMVYFTAGEIIGHSAFNLFLENKGSIFELKWKSLYEAV